MDDIRPNVPAAPVRLLEQLRRHLRDGGYAWKTEQTCRQGWLIPGKP